MHVQALDDNTFSLEEALVAAKRRQHETDASLSRLQEENERLVREVEEAQVGLVRVRSHKHTHIHTSVCQ
jgi:hypothetical protein